MSSVASGGDQHLRSLRVVPAIHATSAPSELRWAGFYEAGPELAEMVVQATGPEQPLELLERLGASPFERGGFPLVGFLATTYDRVSRYALERLGRSGT